MQEDRKQLSYRLDGYHRQRIKDVVNTMPDIRSESDVMQDAIWLWFHEYDLMIEKGLLPDAARTRAPRDQVGGTPEADSPEEQGVEVGEAVSAG
jgi:hypothetical protein